MARFQTVRRDLDDTARASRELGGQLSQFADLRGSIEASLADLRQLGGAHASVKDALEQLRVADTEIARLREQQSETRSWLSGTERSLLELRDQVGELHKVSPTIEVVQKQAQRLVESLTAIEARREFVDDLHKRMADLAALSARLDERDRQLQTRMEAAEQRFVGLAARAEETERLTASVAQLGAQVGEAERKAGQVDDAVASITNRCESVERLAEQTRALKPELDQRHNALKEAAKDLQRANAARKEAAESAQQLEELARGLGDQLVSAERQTSDVTELSTRLEARAESLRFVEKRLGQFEERLTQWDPLEKEILRSLDQISSRQGTVEALQAELDRMFNMAETTATQVREITSTRQEMEQSRTLLADVQSRLQTVRDTANKIDERKRQITKAEERLARAEALLVDVQSSLEALQKQKAIVEQALEKAGSLQFLLKQAEATIENLREEREVATRLRAAVAVVRDEDDDDDEEQAKAA
jgi:chromosome segregation ATPase